jgi:ABC-type uncharacterized transport system substrate-binding protein
MLLNPYGLICLQGPQSAELPMAKVGTTVKGTIIGLMIAVLGTGAFLYFTESNRAPAADPPDAPAVRPIKKVLIINSYHAEYAWSAGVTEGIQSVLNARTGVQLKLHWMDTHRNQSEAFKTQAARDALAVVEEWKPDLVVACDDNAVKYVVEPYLNRTALPVVFCGVSWNLDRYSLATNLNVTGIIEIAHYRQLIEALMPYAKGDRIGYIAGQNVNTDAEVAALKKEFPRRPIRTYAVQTFAEWQAELKKAVGEVDLLLIYNHAGIRGWNPDEARRLIHDAVTVPSGSPNDWMAEYCLMTFAKNAGEQGELAAKAALRILNGTAPSAIPVSTSRKARIFLNMGLAKNLGIRLPMELIENAHLIAPEQYPNSLRTGADGEE